MADWSLSANTAAPNAIGRKLWKRLTLTFLDEGVPALQFFIRDTNQAQAVLAGVPRLSDASGQ